MILSITAVSFASEPFRPGPAESYAHQSADQVTIGAKSFDDPAVDKELFGKKADLLGYGILPVLVVVDNKSTAALDLQYIEVNLVASDGRHAIAVSPDELYHVGRKTKRPNISTVPLPIPKRNVQIQSPEVATRAFVAKVLPPGDSASGFFYFEAKAERGDKLYLNGIRGVRSGKELIYFEFPLEP